MKQQLLLLDDVIGLGRSGDLVSAKPGFVRNFLLPQKKAVIANKQTLKMQTRLKEEREKRAAVDRKEAEVLSEKIKELVLTTEVKVDQEGKMYGSVTALEIARMLQEKGYELDRKHILLAHPFKTLGTHTVELRLKEGVPGSFTLVIEPEPGSIPIKKKREEKAPESEEESVDQVEDSQ